MLILDQKQIKLKIKRLAHQIAEQNHARESIILAGINNNGLRIANLIATELKKIVTSKIVVTNLHLNPAYPTEHPITIDIKKNENLNNKTIIVVDDVANTGRTLFYSFKPLMEYLPFKLEVAVLVDRTHKLFPIKVDYMGLSLATTMKENIEVKVIDTEQMEVYLN